MHILLPCSILVGLVWNVIATRLMGGKLPDAFRLSWVTAGAVAGIVAGLFTVWSRKRTDGKESFFSGLATYYLGIFAYWITFLFIERITMCIDHGGWTDFDLRDNLILIWIFLFYGTFWFGIILIPLAFLSRYLLWSIYQKYADNP